MVTTRGVGERPMDKRSSIQVLARAADVFRALQAHPSGLTQAEIGEQIGLSRSTVSRLVLSLEAEGLVSASGPRGRYRLGPEFVRMAAAARRSAWQEFHPLIAELSAQIGETVDLSVLERDRALFVDQVVSGARLQAVSAVGDSFPLHASANGKALLASLPEPDVRRVILGPLDRFTSRTVTDPDVLERELEQVRKTGIAFDREEHSEGVCAIGLVVGLVDHDLLAVSVPMPTHRFSIRENEILDALGEFSVRVDECVLARER